MIDRVHIRVGTPSKVMAVFDGPNGFLRNLIDGIVRKTDVSRIDLGWQMGDDKLVPYTLVENDTSTGPDTVRTDTGDIIAPDNNSVTRTITIRDMTQAELDARTEAQVQSASDSLDNRRELIALATAIWHIKKGTEPADAFDNLAQYKTWLRSLL